MSSPTISPSYAQKIEGPFRRGLRRFLEKVAKIADVVSIAMMLVLLTVVFLMVVTRSILSVNIVGLDDMARYLQIWVVYTAAIRITMKGDHITMDAVYNIMSSTWKLRVRILTGAILLVVCAITGYLALQQTIEVARLGEVSSSGALPAMFGYASIPFGFFFMVAAGLYYLLFQVHQENPTA
jgi:TRAP-type C4-dicarboxylate transport system permease small subunit